MSLHGIYLREFVRSLPTCTEHEPLGAILNAFNQHRCDRLIVVNSWHHPLRVIRLSDLLPHFSSSVTEAPLDQHSMPLTTLPDGSALGSAVIVLPELWTLEQFLLTQTPTEQEYALVNQDAQVVGLLDHDRLLAYLIELWAGCITSAVTPPVELPLAPPPPIAADADATLRAQQRILTLTQQLLAQRSELEQRIRVQQEEITQLKSPSHIRATARSASLNPLNALTPNTPFALASSLTLLNALLQLIERLPLPLMLQTNQGQVLAQNSVWCQQVGKLSDPSKIWREAAVWLGAQATGTATTASVFAAPDLSIQAGSIAPLPLPQNAPPEEQGLCQLGSQPDSCVCVCPLKDGQEQVVQFVKISLGTLLPNLELNWTTEAIATAEAVGSPPSARSTASEVTPSAVSPFQLATLMPTYSAAANHEADRDSATRLVGASPTLEPPPLQSLWLVMAQDVTQQQHLAKELTAKNADLVQLNRLKDEFLACISHELKTPLTAVLGLSSLLKDQTLGELNQRQVHYAQLIYQSSRHLMGVVNDILDLTRIETGQLELLYGVVDISTVCSRAFEQAKQVRLADTRNPVATDDRQLGTQFSLDIEPNLGRLVADELRLRQMLVHLLSNSLKFTEADSQIGLRVNRWGGWVAFTVWDTGIGIPAEKQHLIFQKFQQLENPLTRQFEGAGLGLVLTRRLARLHGGDVTFISKEGVGSQFTILLPPSPPDRSQLARSIDLEEDDEELPIPMMNYPGGRVPVYSHKAVPDAMPPVVLSANVRDRLILIVEAVPQFVETMTEQLTGLGYRVVIARSGTEALEKARRLQPCVIFLNPLLPLLSGWDVLTLLKSGAETQHLPVVVTATVIDETRALHHQADGFLKLPVKTQKLQSVLQALLPGTRNQETRTPTTALTILRLFNLDQSQSGPAQSLELSDLLRSRQYRILESDDMEQAELLAGVWKPHVILLEGASSDPTAYLQQLSYRPILAALPIVTLNAEVAQAANQIAGLRVFPCLLSEANTANHSSLSHTTLLQVIQVAAGCLWQPTVLAVDLSMLTSDRLQPPQNSEMAERTTEVVGKFPQETEWLQALMQYLQTAGIEGLIGHSWPEVMQQLTSQTVDLLLLCWTNGEPQPEAIECLTQLHQLNPKPPVIVLDHRDPELGETTLIPLPEQVRELATQILSPPIAMAELLEQIQQTLR